MQPSVQACTVSAGARATRPWNGNLSRVLQSRRTTLCESHIVLCAPGPQPPVRVDRQCSTITHPCQRTPVVVSLSPSHRCHCTIPEAPFPSPPHTGPPDLPKPPAFCNHEVCCHTGRSLSNLTRHRPLSTPRAPATVGQHRLCIPTSPFSPVGVGCEGSQTPRRGPC